MNLLNAERKVNPLNARKKFDRRRKCSKKLKAGTGETININTADIELLQRLPYVGKKTGLPRLSNIGRKKVISPIRWSLKKCPE